MLGRTALIILAAFFAVAAPIHAAQSQPPTPSRNISNSPPNPTGIPDQRGTDAAPFVVKVTATPKTNAEAKQDAENPEGQSAADWWIVRLTGALVFATLALVGVTAGLWVATYKLWRAAEHADRPHMLIEQMVVPDMRTPTQRGTLPNAVTLKFAFQNCGNSPAWIKAICIEPLFDLPQTASYPNQGGIEHIVAPNHKLHSVDGIPVFFNIPPEIYAAIMDGSANCFLVGHITYMGMNKRIHKNRFGYKFTAGQTAATDRWDPISNPAWREYT